jgi:hypothetical protein
VCFFLSFHLKRLHQHFTSITAGQVSLGRGLRRTVAMFHSARDLIEENDRRLELMAEDDSHEFTAEYVLTSV